MKLPHAFSPAVMAELARPVASFDPRNAELVEGLAPAWHVVECYSSREREVAKELAKRRFGIYLPLERETIVRRGRKVDVQTLMFPGYVFVFTWLTDTNFTRIASTPGVHQFLMKEDGGRRVTVVLYDEQVDLIRAIENAKGFPLSIKRPRRNSRAGRTRQWELWLDDIRSLDSAKRNQALRKLLGLF
jgi:hypothetical protein